MLQFLSKIIDFGEDAFDNVVETGENILNKTNTFFKNVGGGLDMAREGYNEVVRDDLAPRLRDSVAKGSLAGGSSILTTLGRGYNKMSELSDNKVAQSLPLVGSVFSMNNFAKNNFDFDIFEKAEGIMEHGSDYLEEQNNFLNSKDALGNNITLPPVKWEEAKHDPLKFVSYATEAIGSTIPATATAIAGGLLGGGVGAFATTFAMEGGDQYKEAKQFGASDDEADKALAITGTINGLLETLSLGVMSKFGSGLVKKAGAEKLGQKLSEKISNSVINKLSTMAGKSTLGQWASMVASEVGTEELQNIVSNVVAQSYDENRGAFDNWAEVLRQSAIFSGTLGAGGVVLSHATKTVKDETKDIPNKEGGFISSDVKNGGVEQQNDEKGVIAKDQSELHAEAKKYESADEFIEAQQKVYHGTDAKFDEFDDNKINPNGFHGRGIYFYDDKSIAEETYGDGVKTRILNDDKLFNINDDYSISEIKQILGDERYSKIENVLKEESELSYNNKVGGYVFYNKEINDLLENNGYVGIKHGNVRTAFSKKYLKRESELRKIFEEAHGKKFQTALNKHYLKKNGYITTDEAVKEAMKIPMFKALSERGQLQLKKQLSDPEALGSYFEGVISYVNNPHKTTLPHETFHATLDLALNDHERDYILDIAREESGTENMSDIDAEEWIAQEFADWYVDQTDTTIPARLRRMFEKIKKFITRLLNVDTDKLTPIFEKIIDEDTVKLVTDFKGKGGISTLKNQEAVIWTTEFFNRPFWKKGEHKRITIESEIARIKKPVFRDYVMLKLDTEFAGQEKIDTGIFKRSIISDMLDVKIIESDTYANYGLSRIGSEHLSDEARTYILNTNFNHGVKGNHFGGDFKSRTTKEDLEIRTIKAGTDPSVKKDQYYVTLKNLSNDNLNDGGVFGKFDTDKEAQEYINNFADRVKEEAGMLAHYRAVNNDDTGSFDVLEMQSDFFQHQRNIEQAYRSNKRLMDRELKKNPLEYKDLLDPLKREKVSLTNKILSIKNAKKRISDFENQKFKTTDELKEEQTQLQFRVRDDYKSATYISYNTEQKFKDIIKNTGVGVKDGKRVFLENINKELKKANIDTFDEVERELLKEEKDIDKELKELEERFTKQEKEIRSKYEKEGQYFKDLASSDKDGVFAGYNKVKSDLEDAKDYKESLKDRAFVAGFSGTGLNISEKAIAIANKIEDLRGKSNTEAFKLANKLIDEYIVEAELKYNELKNKRTELQKMIDNYKLSSEDKKEIALSEQFLSLKKHYPEQIIKHAIRQAGSLNAETVRFPTPMTVAFVEGYVEDEMSDVSNEYRYKRGEIDESDIYTEGTNHLGDTGIITEVDDNGYTVIIAKNSSRVPKTFSMEEIADMFPDIFGSGNLYSLEDALKLDPQEFGEYVLEDADNFRVVETKPDKFKILASIFDWTEAQNEKGKHEWTFEELQEYNETYKTGSNIDDFSLSDIESDDYRTIAGKYGIDENGNEGIFYKKLKKLRPDLEEVTDDNGFTWWESKITPNDKQAVELFQKKSQLKKKTSSKKTEKLAKLYEEKYLQAIQLEFTKEALDNNPAKALSKYANKNRVLPEVLGGKVTGSDMNYAKSKFGVHGDDIAMSLGFEDAETARAEYEKYVEQRDSFLEDKRNFIDWKKEAFKEIGDIKNELKLLKQGEREGVSHYKEELTKLQERFIKLIEKSGIDLRDRAKFLRSLKNIKTARNLEVQIAKAEIRITKMKELSNKRILKNKIDKLLKRTKTKLKSGKKFGKFTPEIQSTFDDIRNIMSMSKDELSSLRSDIITKSIEEYGSMTVDNSLQLQIIDVFGDIDEKTDLELFIVYKNVKSLYEHGKALRELSEFNRKTETLRVKDLIMSNLPEILKRKGEVLPFGLKDFIKNSKGAFLSEVALDWDGLMETLSKTAGDQSIRDLLSVFENERKFVELNEDKTRDTFNLFKEVYDVDQKGITKFVRDELNKVIDMGKFVDREGNEIELKMTKDVAIKKYMDFQSPEVREAYKTSNSFTEEMIQAISNSLSAEDKRFGDGLLDLYEIHYQKVSDVFKRIYNVELPKVTRYSPIARQGVKNDVEKGIGEFLDNVINNNVAPSAIKTRVRNNNPILDVGAFSSFDNHMNQTNYFISWAEKVRLLKSVFGDVEVQSSITDKFGKGFYSGVQAKIQTFIDNGALDKLPKFIKLLKSGFIVSKLAVKPLVMAKQFISILAVMEKINPADFVSGVTEFAMNPKGIWDMMNDESVILRNRGETFDYHINDAINIDRLKKFSTVKEKLSYLMFNVKFGDKFAGLVSAYALRKKLLKQGMPLDKVILEYEKYIHDTQQSGFLSKLRNTQIRSWSQLFTWFMTSQAQYLQKEVLAINSLLKEGGTKPENIKKVAKVIFIYHFMLPVLFQFMANMGRTDDDAMKDYKRAMILGSFNGILIFRDMADATLRALFGQYVFDPSIPFYSTFKDITKELKKMTAEDVTPKEFITAMSDVGLTSAGVLTGFPEDFVKRFIEGSSDVVAGNVNEGLWNMFGYSDYQLSGGKSYQERKAIKRYAPVKGYYDDIKEAIKNGDEEKAKSILRSVPEEHRELLKKYKKYRKTKHTNKLKKELLHTAKRVYNFAQHGDKEAVKNIVSSLSKEEQDVVKKLIKKLKKEQE